MAIVLLVCSVQKGLSPHPRRQLGAVFHLKFELVFRISPGTSSGYVSSGAIALGSAWGCEGETMRELFVPMPKWWANTIRITRCFRRRSARNNPVQ